MTRINLVPPEELMARSRCETVMVKLSEALKA